MTKSLQVSDEFHNLVMHAKLDLGAKRAEDVLIIRNARVKVDVDAISQIVDG